MSQAFAASRTVEHSADDVWRRLTDWGAAAGWLGVDGVRADGPTDVGTRLTFRTRGRERTAEIVALDPGRSVTLRSRQGGVTADYVYSVEPAGAGARLGLLADVRTTGLWRPLAPVIRAAIRRTDSGQLDALARALATSPR
jgi:uncharacterized protein YndB with AHSA1/START domain